MSNQTPETEGDPEVSHRTYLQEHYTRILKAPGEEAIDQLVEERLQLESRIDRDGLLPEFFTNNRFTYALEVELDRIRRQHTTTATLLALDIDKLREVNARLGHPRTDDLIRVYGQVIVDQVRIEDHKGRLGGDEFGVLLIGVDEIKAIEIADRIRQEVKDRVRGDERFPFDEDRTISIGIAEARLEDSPESLRQRADDALYKAKEVRDTTITYSQLQQPAA